MSNWQPPAALEPVGWADGRLRLLDQNALPAEEIWREYDDWRDAADAIRTMVVRGAPAIGCAAGLALALAARHTVSASRADFDARIAAASAELRATRPTAVNLFWALDRVEARMCATEGSPGDVRDAAVDEALAIVREDLEACRAIGRYGAPLLPDDGGVLTHCNAGALATAGYGTALGVIRAAVAAGKRIAVYADETRPRLQGMRLTAWELMREGIPVTIVPDGAAAALMRSGRVSCVVVGADRIAANGDTANKIGTYSVAVAAHHHAIPFYVAAPQSTFDAGCPDGAHIPIEERAQDEVTSIAGQMLAPQGARAWNPAFDVTPPELISGFITDTGLVSPPARETGLRLESLPEAG